MTATFVVKPQKEIGGDFAVPPDKSISQRAVIFGAVASGATRIRNLLLSADVLSAVGCVRALGIFVEEHKGDFIINGRGLLGLSEPSCVLDAGNSGTCMRLLSGILAAQGFYSVLTGDGSLCSRPMGRIVEPLSRMGARIWGRDGGRFAPLSFGGGSLSGIDYTMPVASAQVKSCLLGAALYAEGRTVVREPVPSRDHTERMLQAMGARIRRDEGIISVEGGGELNPLDVDVPGDISSAAYVVAAGLIVPGPGVRVRGVGLNPTRTGLLSVLRRMGASVRIENEGITSWGEPVGDMVVEYSELSGTEIDGGEIPLLIDELPILAVLAALARGRTVVRGASELRLKESDRIREIVKNLRFMGADAREREDGFQVEGGRGLKGAEIDPSGDHRMAMTFAVAGLAADSPTAIRQSGVASVSFPGFWDLPIFES